MSKPLDESNNDTSLKTAFAKGLDFLGEDARDALAINLKEKYGIDLENNNVKLGDLEFAISQLFGQSAYFIIDSIRRELKS